MIESLILYYYRVGKNVSIYYDTNKGYKTFAIFKNSYFDPYIEYYQYHLNVKTVNFRVGLHLIVGEVS